MSYDEFWKCDPSLFWAYRTSFIESEKRQNELDNYKSWLSGLYNYKAFSVVEYNLNRKEGATVEDYFDKPLDFTGMHNEYEEEQRKIKKKKALQQQLEAMLIKSKVIIEKDKGKS